MLPASESLSLRTQSLQILPRHLCCSYGFKFRVVSQGPVYPSNARLMRCDEQGEPLPVTSSSPSSLFVLPSLSSSIALTFLELQAYQMANTSKGFSRSTDHVLSKLLRMSLGTAAVTTVLAIANALAFLLNNKTAGYYIIFSLSVPKAYVICFLYVLLLRISEDLLMRRIRYVLNSRQGLRLQAEGSTHEGRSARPQFSFTPQVRRISSSILRSLTRGMDRLRMEKELRWERRVGSVSRLSLSALVLHSSLVSQL